VTGPEHREVRLAALEAEVAGLRARLVQVEADALAARVLRGGTQAHRSPVRRPVEGRGGTGTFAGTGEPDEQERRIAALEAAVRELNDRLDDPEPYVAAAQADGLARIVDRHPDLLEDRRTLG
jgi:hypothetical protein